MLFMFSINAYAYDYDRHTSSYTEKVFADYMENVKSKLAKNWTAPDFSDDLHTRIVFQIDNEGYVLSAKIVESSGNTLHDESAIYALQKSEPFGNFPNGTTKTSVTINYSFDTTNVRTEAMRKYLSQSDKSFSVGDNEYALKYINMAIEEVKGDEKAYYLYR